MIDRRGVVLCVAALAAGPALLGQTQSQAVAAEGACGDPAVQFRVEATPGHTPSAPPAGKALVVFIEKDAGAAVASTTLAGMDGEWMGATHGNSWFDFAVDPGVHHLCAITHFSGWIGGGADGAMLHFDAQAGQVYYFEVTNLAFSAERQADVTLTAVDSDEGKYLVSRAEFSTAKRKK
jgi:hypothetical protein